MIKEYFEAIAHLGIDGKQLLFNKWIQNRLKTVVMVPHKHVLDDIQHLDTKIKQCKLEVKQCYANSANIVLYLGHEFNNNHQELFYVEGYTTVCGIVIEHGWNCLVTRNNYGVIVSEEHFDITRRWVLGQSMTQIHGEEYMAVQYYSKNEMLKLMLTNRCNGPFLHDMFLLTPPMETIES